MKLQLVAEVSAGTAWKENENETESPLMALNFLLAGVREEIYGRSEAGKIHLRKIMASADSIVQILCKSIWVKKIQNADIKPGLTIVLYSVFRLLIRPVSGKLFGASVSAFETASEKQNWHECPRSFKEM